MDSKNRTFLECERQWVFALLIFVGGFYGSYTYLLRGGVFCNAQTANFVLFAIELGNFRWARAAYYLIPMTAYMMGAFVSEAISLKLTRVKFLRWETILVGIEILFIAALGFVPDSAPFQISQVAINFICSMQYNTFRQAQGVAVATTFVTNHIRQIGVGLAKAFHHRHSADKSHRMRLSKHSLMLLFFAVGIVVGTLFCNLLGERAIWMTILPLGVIFTALLHADLTTEKDLVEQKPAGH